MTLSWLHSVHHDGSLVSALTPRFGETVTVRLRVGLDAPVREIYLRTAPDGEQHFVHMHKADTNAVSQWWEVNIAVNEPQIGYRFLIVAEDGIWYYNAAGIHDYDPLDVYDFRILGDYHAPDWLQTAVFYQIFPDNFANGDPTLNISPDAYDYRGRKAQLYEWEQPLPTGAYYSSSYYGGDLPGVIQHLDYLHSLGINTVYLNPIFKAYSCHKYDVIDYEQVDPYLGGNQALIDLRRELDVRGMRYILDIVPNHCGMLHPWFLTAQLDPTSEEYGFFSFTDYPDKYVCWANYPSLPKLNYTSQELRRRMYGNGDSVFRRWLLPPYSADGWRVDVANMLGRQGETQLNAEVIREMREAVKETQPEAYLMGENFFDASGQLQGDQWDGVMNYKGFSSPLLDWLKGFTQGALGFQGIITSPVQFPTSALEASWRTRRAAIPWAIALQQFNLVTSHDTHRVRSQVGENDALHRLAVVVHLTFPGVPCIYYGDEIGMVDVGGVTPMSGSSRGCMIWDEERWNHDLLAFFRDLIALRKQSVTLQRGGFQMLAVEDDLFAYQRELNGEHVVVIANRGTTPRPAGGLAVAHGNIEDGTRFREHFSGQEAVVAGGMLPLPEQGQGASLWEKI